MAIGRPLRQLSFAAQEIGQGKIPGGDRSNIREINQVTDALRAAATTRQAQDAALKEKRHLEALGRLTGGIAHDFNNVLTIVSGNLQLIGMRSADPAIKEMLAEAGTVAEFGARLNQRLMRFAQQRDLVPTAFDLNQLVRTTMELARSSIGTSIEMTSSFEAAPATVLLDISELENAVINLALNARDAMPSGGTLFVGTDNVEIPATISSPTVDLPAGAYVRVIMRDTGIGMTEEVRTRAFDPFYTTKEQGRGNGLGLTGVLGFARQSGGDVTIVSTPGNGTAIAMLFPMLTGRGPADRFSRPAAA